MTFNEAMQKALRASKYNYINGTYEDIGEKISNFIANILAHIFSAFNLNFAGYSPAVNPSVISGIFVVLAIISVVTAVAVIAWFIIKRKRKSTIIGEIFDDYRSNKLSYEEIMSLAVKNDAEGNWRQSVRYRYIGLIMLFDSRGIVRVTDSMTGTQFIREASKNVPRFSNAIRQTVNIYYSLYFGHKTIAGEIYSQHLASYNEMTREAASYE